MSHGFENKVVVITGAGKGLGRAYALFLAGRGARIVVNNRIHPGEETSSADHVVAEIKEAGGSAIAEYSSVEDPVAGDRVLKLALETFGRLDAIVANAGVGESRSFHKQKIRDFQRIIEINLIGTAITLHPAFCHMYAQRRGSIVVSTSVAGLYGGHGLPAYSASKAALLGLMYSLSQEGASHGIRVNALAPFAETQMTQELLPAALKGRVRSEQVAPVLAWLISDACKLNGETLISGAGVVSRARIMETAPNKMSCGPEFESQLLDGERIVLAAGPLDQSYHSSQEQFRNFMAEVVPVQEN